MYPLEASPQTYVLSGNKVKRIHLLNPKLYYNTSVNFHKKLALNVSNLFYTYTLRFANFLDRRDVETKFCKLLHKGFAWHRKCILLPECVISVQYYLVIPQMFVSVYLWHLQTISNRCIIYLLIIIRVPVKAIPQLAHSNGPQMARQRYAI